MDKIVKNTKENIRIIMTSALLENMKLSKVGSIPRKADIFELSNQLNQCSRIKLDYGNSKDLYDRIFIEGTDTIMIVLILKIATSKLDLIDIEE